MSPGNFYAGRVALRQMIYNGGRNQPILHLAEAALAQARIHEESIRGQVTVNAVSAFYDVLLAQKRLALTDSAQSDRRFSAMATRLRARTMGSGRHARIF
jgi:outer membrane protein TolC